MDKMKAVRIHSYGGHDVLALEEAPVPDISEDDVLIRVHAAGVNPVDWKVRAGYLEGMLSYHFPVILGWDVSGVVEKAGSEVTDKEVGEEVYAFTDISRDGAYADYVAVKAGFTALKPRSIDHVQAASIPLAALTAWQSLFDAADLTAGQTVLIHAAAGGVGSFAVQFARWKGARVIGTASARNRDYLIDLGAHEVVDYTQVPFEDAVSDVDVVLDAVAGETQDRSWQVLKEGGVLVSILGPPDEGKAAERGVRGVGVFVQPNGAQLGTIAGLIEEGHVRTSVTETFPLPEAARAHALSETEHVRGKIVLKIRD